MKTRYSHIHFSEDLEQLDPEKPTYLCPYLCRNNKSDNILGVVAYYLPWKKYEFIGEEGAGFDTSCLRDIIHFMEQLAQKGAKDE